MNILKLLPIFLIIIAIILTLIISLINNFSIEETYIRLLVIVPAFYFLGILICKFITNTLLEMKDKVEKQKQSNTNNKEIINNELKSNEHEEESDFEPISFKHIRTSSKE